jgi:hypothetical protein
VITQLRPSHTSAEFVVFLNKINREVPAGLDVHVVLDNLSTHKTPAVHEWLLRHKRFHFHFNPDLRLERHPKLFTWHKSADDILQRLAGYRTAINQMRPLQP